MKRRVQVADVELQGREIPRGVRFVHVRVHARDSARIHRGEPSGVVALSIVATIFPSRLTRARRVRLDLLGRRCEGYHLRQEQYEDGERAAARSSPHPPPRSSSAPP